MNALILIVIFLGVYLLVTYYKSRSLPPGPYGWTIFGPLYRMFRFREDIYMYLYELSKEYGSICSMTMGQSTYVILSDPQLIRDAFNQQAFTGKGTPPLYKIFKGFGVVNVSGVQWREERKFLHSAFTTLGMKKYGSARQRMEDRIEEELSYLFSSIEAAGGAPINIDHSLTTMTTNVISTFLTSERYEPSDPFFVEHKQRYTEGFKLFAALDFTNYYPILQYLPWNRSNMKQLVENHQESLKLYKHTIQRRRKTFVLGDKNDILDAYLTKEHGNEANMINFEEQVSQVLCDLVSAGAENVRAIITWTLLHMIHQPDAVLRMRAEIETVVGSDRSPNLEDQTDLVYCQAFINEVLRISNIVPMNPAHVTEENVELQGRVIPKGSTVIALLYACHMSPKYWDEPEQFRPERFIDDSGKLISHKAFIPFGKGQRNCLGDTIAKSQSFLFTTKFIQKFNIQSPSNEPLPSLKGIPGVTNSPAPFRICVTPLKSEKLLNNNCLGAIDAYRKTNSRSAYSIYFVSTS